MGGSHTYKRARGTKTLFFEKGDYNVHVLLNKVTRLRRVGKRGGGNTNTSTKRKRKREGVESESIGNPKGKEERWRESVLQDNNKSKST